MLQSLAGSSCVRLVERHRSAWCFGLLVLGYLLYLVFGAVVFSSVELPYEDLLRQELRKLKRSFVEEHKCLSEAQLESFLARVLEASNYGVSVLSNASANWNWDFTSSLFFASTVLSTTATLCVWSQRKEISHCRAVLRIPVPARKCTSNLWSTTSDAADGSNGMRKGNPPQSNCCWH